MKVTFVAPEDNLGGGNRVIAIYASKLQEMGHDITIAYQPRQRTSFLSKVGRLVKNGTWPLDPDVGIRFGKVPVRIKIIERRRPIVDSDLPDADVVVATWFETAYWVNNLSPSKGKKFYFVQDFGANSWQPMDRLIETWRMPMHKIVISTYIRDLVRSNISDSEELSLVLNGADLEQFRVPERGKQEVPTVGTIYSTADTFKGLDVTLTAVELAKVKLPNLRVVAFGPSHETPRYPLPQNSLLYTKAREEELASIYSACDVWLFSALKEGFGLPVIEAMTCRTPVIATRAGAAPDLIGKGGGLLVDYSDPQAMADAIVQICSLSDEEWRALSSRAYEIVRGYSWDDAAREFERVIAAA